MLNVRGGGGCDTDHSLVIIFKDKMAVNKLQMQVSDMQRLNLKKQNEIELKNSVRLSSQTELQILKVHMLMQILLSYIIILPKTV
jgi:adenylate kinase